MRKLFLIIVFSSPMLLITSAQDLSGVKVQLDAMFAGLDKSKVSTGYLWDSAANLVDGEMYDGSHIADSNFVDIPRLYDMIQSINSASVGADTIPALRAIRRIQEASTRQSAIVGFLFKPYNYIVANALQDNLINYNNGVVSDKYINGVWQNPYGEKAIVGYAVGNNATVYQSVSFTLQNVDSLSTQSFSSVQFDAGDGLGYRNVSVGIPFDISYSSSGDKETKLLLVSNGITYLSHTLIHVVDALQPITNNIPHTNSIPNTITHPVEATFEGKTYHAMVSCLPTATFDNPLIVAEMFDPWAIFLNGDNWNHSYAGINNINSLSSQFKNHFEEFDIFYVDWYDYGADIRANARLLEEVINWVNSNKTSGNANVVLGQSMGGLIARCCLCDMENKGVPHDTKLYISHDVPHLGVNISPGLQFAYWDLNKTAGYIDLFDITPEFAQNILKLGTLKSVRQMLPVYVNADGVYNNTEYESLQSVLNNVGFPKGYAGRPIENVAIVNGGRSPNGPLSYYVTTDTLLHLSFNTTASEIIKAVLESIDSDGNYSWISGGATLCLSYDIFPYLSNSSMVRYFDLSMKKNFLWIWPITLNIIHKENYSPNQGYIYDNYSGSYYYLNLNVLSSSIVEPADFSHINYLQVIPTASALCSTDYSRDFYNNPVTPGQGTCFDSYLLWQDGSRHTSLTDTATVNTWLQNVTAEVNIPPVVFNGDTLKITGANVTFQWSSSNESVATVGNNGIVQRVSDGLTEFRASYYLAGQAITKTRKSVVGYPSVSLASQDINGGNSFVIQAALTNTAYDDIICDAVNKGILQYRWGIKAGTGSGITWRNTQSDTIHVSIPNTQDCVTVYMKWCHGNNEETITREMVLVRPNKYYTNIDAITVNTLSGLTYIENPYHSFPSIMSSYGHICLTFRAASSSSLRPVTSITIKDCTFPVTGVHYLPDSNGVVYVYDILYDLDFKETFIVDPIFLRFGLFSMDIYLNDSDGTFQCISIPCRRIRF